MITLGSGLFVLMTLLIGSIAALLYDSYKKSKNEAVESLFLVFLFIFFYAAILSIFSIISNRNLVMLGWSYNVSILFGFGAMYFGLRLPIFNSYPEIEKNIKKISWGVIVIAALVLAIQIVDFRLPIINANGVIFWNLNPLAAWLTSFVIFIYTLTWSYITYSNAKLLEDPYLRLKLYTLAFNIAALGISAFVFFPSASEWQSFLSLIIIIPAYLATIGVLIFLRAFKF